MLLFLGHIPYKLTMIPSSLMPFFFEKAIRGRFKPCFLKTDIYIAPGVT